MRQSIEKPLYPMLIPAIMPQPIAGHHFRKIRLYRPRRNMLRRMQRSIGKVILRLSAACHQCTAALQ
jgi:hypothetical protein